MSDLPTIHEQAPYLSVVQIKNIPTVVHNGYYDTLNFLDKMFYPLKWLASTFAWLVGECYSLPINVFSFILNDFYKFGVAFLKMSYIASHRMGSIMASLPIKEEIEADYKNLSNIEDAMKHLRIPFNQLGLLLLNLRNVVSYLARFVLGSVYSVALHIISIPVTPVYLLSLGMINIIIKPTLNLFKSALVQLGSTLGVYRSETRLSFSPGRAPKKNNHASRVNRVRDLLKKPEEVHTNGVVINVKQLNIEDPSQNRMHLATFVNMVAHYFGECLEDRLSIYNEKRELKLTKKTATGAYNTQFISSKVLAEIRSNDLTSELKALLLPKLDMNIVSTSLELSDAVIYLITEITETMSNLDAEYHDNTINLLGIHGSPCSNTQELAGIKAWCDQIQAVREGQNYPNLIIGDDALDKEGVVDQLLDVLINASWILILAKHYNTMQISSMLEAQSQFSSAPASPPRSLVTSPVRSDQFSRQAATSKPTEGNLITRAWGAIASVFSIDNNNSRIDASYVN